MTLLLKRHAVRMNLLPRRPDDDCWFSRVCVSLLPRVSRVPPLSRVSAAGRLCRVPGSRGLCTHGEPGTGSVVSKRHGNILSVGINRPHVRNCVNAEAAQRLHEAFTAFEEDDDLLVLVLHGIGGNFCAGYDLKELANTTTPITIPDVGKGPGPMGPSRMELTKPVIAAVSGYAVAGGLELALLADMRVVEEDATMGVFCRRFGVPLIDGGTVRLPKLIGLSRALDLILTGRPVDAQEAFHFGLANRITTKGKAFEEAMKLAEQISCFPQKCLRSDRQSAYRNAFCSQNHHEALQFELNNAKHVISEESIKGSLKFKSGYGRGGRFNDP
ncbi:carnitinyl-CoA dehydratase-like [Lethenteron reissneri]|uniref:carnitinyl-CoA dehydratase-like n=1 Tax=Lethenteron reissneri TaxID=7753 RepID=UPI002AB67499|nr:carnitinyl-CoA dehydratase-like [Lethenteron reissneri]